MSQNAGLDRRAFLKNAGIPIPKGCDFLRYHSLPRHSPPAKLKLFSNGDDIIRWYKKSYMNKIYRFDGCSD